MNRAFLFLPLIAACATMPASGPLTGQWGAQHIGLVLTGSGGQLDYDCAAGTIDGPLIVQPDNRFTATGRHTPRIGGPEQVGQVRPSYPARYSGSVSGDVLTLRVDVPSQGIVIGPYTLRRGAEPVLMRCL